ncbi:MAG: signal peptidase II [Verrucomicrobia bacterium]|nr:signal peptidase II [Verrucomicrobiota bacterium]
MLILCLSFGLAVIDQLTKHLVQEHIHLGGAVTVVPGFFDLRYIQNTGAAWGIFQGRNSWLVAVSIIMLATLVTCRRYFITPALSSRLAIGCIIGGIVGNLADRLRVGYVIDFLDFHAGGHAFPAFNVADSAICVGVALYMFSQWRADQANAGRDEQPKALT